MTAPGTENPLALYVHWPWCQSKCPYCDFNSHATPPDDAGWRDAILREMETEARALGLEGRALLSIFFGGGTPSLMDPRTVAAVIDRAAKLFAPTPDIEITLEANPSSVEVEKFRALHAAGVNRVSVGVQSFDDDALRFMERAHTADEAKRAIDMAGNTFERFSFDLIYARPDQTAAAWESELNAAFAFAPTHLSLYQLTIEPGTRFARDRVESAGEDLGADLFDLTNAIMDDAGLPAYEISNHARPGEEARHNVHVWQGGDYLGVGPGAHGRVFVPSAHGRVHLPRAHGRVFVPGGANVCQQPGHWDAHRRAPDPARWAALVAERGNGTAATEEIGARDRTQEIIMGALRLREGLNTDTLQAITGIAFEDAVDADAFGWLIDETFLERNGPHIRTTPKGRLALNAVLAKLLS